MGLRQRLESSIALRELYSALDHDDGLALGQRLKTRLIERFGAKAGQEVATAVRHLALQLAQGLQ